MTAKSTSDSEGKRSEGTVRVGDPPPVTMMAPIPRTKRYLGEESDHED